MRLACHRIAHRAGAEQAELGYTVLALAQPHHQAARALDKASGGEHGIMGPLVRNAVGGGDVRRRALDIDMRLLERANNAPGRDATVPAGRSGHT